MKKIYIAAALLLLTSIAHSQQPETEPDFRPLFNGKNLDGWVPVNTAESTWSVRDGMLICTGKPIGELRTDRMYQNFVLEVEWRHMKPKGNAGIFVWADDITSRGVPFHRSIEVQVLENAYGNTRGYTTHGDIFPIHGATMTPVNGRGGSRAFPTENRSNPSPAWNHYRIECRDGSISLAVNGKVVTRGTDCNPRKGYICIESEGGVVHYRNMRIMELPDTPLDPKYVAIADRGFECLYDGIALDNWNTAGKWLPSDWILKATSAGSIASQQTYGNQNFIVDVRFSKSPETLGIQIGSTSVSLDPRQPDVAAALTKGQAWNRIEGQFEGDALNLHVNGQPVKLPVTRRDTARSALRLETTGPLELSNIYVRSAK